MRLKRKVKSVRLKRKVKSVRLQRKVKSVRLKRKAKSTRLKRTVKRITLIIIIVILLIIITIRSHCGSSNRTIVSIASMRKRPSSNFQTSNFHQVLFPLLLGFVAGVI